MLVAMAGGLTACRLLALPLVLFLVTMTTMPVTLGHHGDVVPCPERCVCSRRPVLGASTNLHHDILTDCSFQELNRVPESIWHETTILNLRFNHLTSLNATSFNSAELPELHELILTGNELTNLERQHEILCSWSTILRVTLDYNRVQVLPDSFMKSSSNMRSLSCVGCGLSQFPTVALNSLKYLQELHLSGNDIGVVDADDLKAHPYLRKLIMNNCSMEEFPREALATVPELRELSFSHNEISELQSGDFNSLPSLTYLDLAYNNLTSLPALVFASLTNLQYLSLDNNPIQYFESMSNFLVFDNMVHLQVLSLRRLQLIKDRMLVDNYNLFWKLKELSELHLDGNVERRPNFAGLLFFTGNAIKELYWGGHTFKSLGYVGKPCALEKLRMPTGTLETMHWEIGGICGRCNRLTEIDMANNKLTDIDPLQNCTQLTQLYLKQNQLTTAIVEKTISFHTALVDVVLSHNHIERLKEFTLGNMSRLEHLDLSYNPLVDIHPRAFMGTPMLHRLILNGTQFPKFPELGLPRLFQLDIAEGVTNLHVFPPSRNYPSLRFLKTEYHFHCCRWEHWDTCDTEEEGSVGSPDPNNYRNANLTHLPIPFGGSFEDMPPEGFFTERTDEQQRQFNATWSRATEAILPIQAYTGRVCCMPHPNGLTPCFDLLGESWLRVLVWIVIAMAIVGNGTVLVVVGVSKQRIMQTKPLVMSLAFGDLTMGIYMLVLGIVDLMTKGEFSQYAVNWKEGAACKSIGFLAVFSSLVSVFSLTVITLDRYITIIHAMKVTPLNSRRLKRILLVGWLVMFLVALLPIFGVNNYSAYVVCLPLASRTAADIFYVVLVLGITAISFLLIIVCYIHIYVTIRRSPAPIKPDYQTALKMAVLIFIDLCCWSPIWVLSFHALATHKPYITLQQAKYIIVLVFPLNSCANPFLYAILTRNFQRDLVKMITSVSLRRRSSFMPQASGGQSGETMKNLRDVMAQLQREGRRNARKTLGSQSSNTSNKASYTSNHPVPAASPTRLERMPSQLNSSSSGTDPGPIAQTIDAQDANMASLFEQTTSGNAHAETQLTSGTDQPTTTPAHKSGHNVASLHSASSSEDTRPASAPGDITTGRNVSKQQAANKCRTVRVNRSFLSPFTHCDDCSISRGMRVKEDEYLAWKQARKDRQERRKLQKIEEKRTLREQPRSYPLQDLSAPRRNTSATAAAATAALSGLVPMFIAQCPDTHGQLTTQSQPVQSHCTKRDIDGDHCSILGDEENIDGDLGAHRTVHAIQPRLDRQLRNIYVTSL
ncbi:thyrotropin receptor-like [Sycon ciliatum]|uniref:thyrotropin receptor-like n=1 Tax=Sycon ciliatum TaxID=27933 RepID=UPI0031F6A228